MVLVWGRKVSEDCLLSDMTFGRCGKDKVFWKGSGVGVNRNGTPGGSRTPNLLIRSQMLYPIELRVHPRNRNRAVNAADFKLFLKKLWGKIWGC